MAISGNINIERSSNGRTGVFGASNGDSTSSRSARLVHSVIGSTTDSGSVSLDSSSGGPARYRSRINGSMVGLQIRRASVRFGPTVPEKFC